MLTQELIYDIVTGRVTWKEFQAIETTIEDRRLLYDIIMTIYNNIDFYNSVDEFPNIGHIKKLYVDISTDASYIWHNGEYHITNNKAINDLKEYVDNNFLSFTNPQSISEEQKTQIVNSIGVIKSTINLTYDELVELRDNNELITGQYYRIIDFVTIIQDPWQSIYGEETVKSAGHAFDIIVHALSNNVLSENAEADISSTDNSNHFQYCKLNAWKLKYCLDNDVNRFAWANPVEGKGVIYELIDEWNNKCSYDFKNIMYKRYPIYDNTESQILDDLNGEYLGILFNNPYGFEIDDSDFIWVYTFTHFSKNSNIPEDYSSIHHEIGQDTKILHGFCNDNIIEPCRVSISEDDGFVWVSHTLNNIVLISREGWEGGSSYTDFEGNHFEPRCRNITCSSGSYGNVFKHDVMNCIFANNFSNNIIGNRCSDIAADYNFMNNVIEQDCHRLIFGSTCRLNNIRQECREIEMDYNSIGNILGVKCQQIHFNNSNNHNEIGNECYDINFGTHSSFNIINGGTEYIKIPDYVSNAKVLNGVSGTPGTSGILIIDFVPNVSYTQFAGITSDNELVVWNPADLV